MADEMFHFTDSSEADVASLIRVRSLLSGFSGSGKTYTALRVATELATLLEPVYGRRPTIWGLDTERESMLLYRNEFRFRHLPFPPPHKVSRYLEAFAVLRRQARPGDIFLLDSMSHAWQGPGGILERVDKEATKFGGNKWAAWGVLTPEQNKLVDELLALPMHLFCTTRAKVEWAEAEERGKKTYKKVGTQSVQREGLEYEFTLELVCHEKGGRGVDVGKTRVKSLEGEVFDQPGIELAEPLFRFAMTGRGDAPPEEVKRGVERFRAGGGVADKSIAEVEPKPVVDERRPGGPRVSATEMVAAAAEAAAAGKAQAAASTPAAAAGPATAPAGATSASSSAAAQPAPTAGSSSPASTSPASAATQTAGTSSATAGESVFDSLVGRVAAARTADEIRAVRPAVKLAVDLGEVSAEQAAALAGLEAARSRDVGEPAAAAKTEAERLEEEVTPQAMTHRALAVELVGIPIDDVEAFRKFPGKIAEASKKKLLDQVGYDDLVAAYKATKKIREKKGAADKREAGRG